ncbi:MAG: GNAT family N-acetyltransferase [Anaerolineales bacterium]|nr:GNAT family N-acetyltransferase [Anaerolineales bacterium]
MNDTTPQITIRPAGEDDIPKLLEIEHGYSTEYAWQMDADPAGAASGVRFRETRLPRAMQVQYPRPKEALSSQWKQRSALLVAEEGGATCGYAALAAGYAPGAVWLTDLVVALPQRRKGIGARLVLAAQQWARQHGHGRMVLEMQSKNHPAICLAQKLAFTFSGYSDGYYENQDIALFFAKRLT